MSKKLRYVVVDPETNSIVVESGAKEHAHPASLTKMLNLLMVFEAMTHNDTKLMGSKVKIPETPLPKALAQFEAFKLGEAYDINVLLAASGNKSEARSTVALAYALGDENAYGWGGTEEQRRERFLTLTNERLEEIGLTDTDIHVLTGWKNSQHHTTARDIAVAMDYIQSNFPKSAEIAMGQARAEELKPYTPSDPVHSSRLLRARPERVLWAKTGYLKEHGYSHAVYYEKDEKPLIAVVLGADTKSESNSKVLEILTEAYEKLNDANYEPTTEYEDVTFDPNGLMPGTSLIPSIRPKGRRDHIEETVQTTEPIKTPEPPEEPALPYIDGLVRPEDATTISAELPKTKEGYIDLSKILPEDIPVPVFAPMRPDTTVRFPVCDAPELPISDHVFQNAPMLRHAFSDAEPTKAPETDQEMFDAVYNIALRDKMISEEGRYNNAYYDTEGYLTVGIGHLIGDDQDLFEGGPELKEGDTISDLCVDRLFEQDASKAINAAIGQARDIGRFQTDFVIGLVSVNFQLGENWPKEWPKAYGHMKAGDFPSAMVEVMSAQGGRKLSKWSQQTPYRALNLLKVLANEANEDIRAAKMLSASADPEITTPDVSPPETKP